MMEHGPFDLDSLPVNVIGIGAFIAKSTGERGRPQFWWQRRRQPGGL